MVECRFLQDNADRREIFAVVTGAGPALGFGPLTMGRLYEALFTEPVSNPWGPKGDAALGADLTARASELHPLDDFFRFYEYPPDVVAWIEATPVDDRSEQGTAGSAGRDLDEVARRLGLDRKRLLRAAGTESIVENAFDPAGDPMHRPTFFANWAAGDETFLAINPNAYRFKAWLSMEN